MPTIRNPQHTPSLCFTARRPVAIGIVFAAGAAAWWSGMFTATAPPSELLRVEPAALEFGRVWEDREFEWKIEIENTSGRTLPNVEFAASCDCTNVEPRSLSLQSREKAELRLTIDLIRARMRAHVAAQNAKGQNDTAPDPLLAVEQEAGVEIKARCQGTDGDWLPVQTWLVRGTARPVLSFEAAGVSFGNALIEKQAFPSRTVRARAHTPLESLEATAEKDFATVEVRRREGDAEEYGVVILPNSNLGVGKHDCEVWLAPVAANGEPLPRLRIPVEMVVLPDIQATPGTLSFGACPCGTAVSETVVMQSHRGDAFEADSIAPDSSDIVVEAVRNEAAFKQFRITQQATEKGERSTTLIFAVRREGEEDRLLTLPVRYLGIEE